ncbi:hypothetical protein SDC9_175369 [bioreactor metagenome]|uniref:Uncharacterized protein n=1 Tax=bioreactor metagenome TaxID=1076179 RepID=A0A645GMI2_9ZZZZ
MLPLNRQRMLKKRRTTNGAQATLLLPLFRHRTVLTYHFAVVRQIDRHIKTRQRNAPNDLVNMIEFGFLGAHKLAPGGGVVEQIEDFQRGAYGMRGRFDCYLHVAPFGVGLPGFLLLCGA